VDGKTVHKLREPRAAAERRKSHQSRPSPELSLSELEAQITELTGQLNAATYRWLKQIAEFDRRRGWSGAGLYSCAHWLNFKCGLAFGAAREKVRVARALEHLPRLSAAMAAGQLSYSKVRALTRVAETATEEYLLHIALHGTAQHVENLVRLFRRSQEALELSREAQQQARRAVGYWFDSDGSLVLRARLPALAGAVLIKALNLALEDLPKSETNVVAHPPSEECLSWQARRADALARVAEGFLQRGTQGSRQQGSRGSTADRYQVVVHVEAQTLRDSSAGRCEIEHGPALPAETVRRLSCDASLVTLIENSRGEPLDVGRKTRSIPPALRRALNARDRTCRFPGCTHQRYLDAHHIRHWAQGGATKLANLVTLCGFHHRLVHEGGIRVSMRPDGTPCFMRPDGSEFDQVVSLEASYDWREIPARHAEQGIHIDRRTAVTRWCGERMDYDLAVSALQQQVMRRHEASHELPHELSEGLSDIDSHNDSHDTSHNESPDASDSVPHNALHDGSHDVPAGTSEAAHWERRTLKQETSTRSNVIAPSGAG